MEIIPKEFKCPLTKKILIEPVITTIGTIYERNAIEEWLKNNSMDPLTKKRIANKLIPVYNLKTLIIEEYSNNPQYIKTKNELIEQTNISGKLSKNSICEVDKYCNGKGKIIDLQGNFFEGEWKNGSLWSGFGKFIDVENNNYFKGEWRNGKYWTGIGKLTIPNKINNFLKGEWKDGKFLNGFGTITKCEYTNNYEYFSGEWKNGIYWHGRGRIHINNRLLIGEILYGKKITNTSKIKYTLEKIMKRYLNV